MKHLTQEQLVLHCYGDAGNGQAIDLHLEVCTGCRAEFQEIKALLAEIPPVQVPEPPEYLEQKVWLNLRDQLEEQEASLWRRLPASSKWTAVAAAAVLVAASFLAGRFWPHAHGEDEQKPPDLAQVSPQRVVLAAVGDHLERSQMLLIELMNGGAADASTRQQQARNLLEDNQLYRQSALRAGDPEVARVLDELERVLVELANAPPDLNASNVLEIRKRIQSQDLLFKIHVLGTKISRTEPHISSADQRL